MKLDHASVEKRDLTWVSDGESAHSVELTTSCAKIDIVYNTDQELQSVRETANCHACACQA